jgi:hypothetical protein
VAAPLQSSMPQFTQLGNNAKVVLEALDPTTGAAVTGVVFSNVDIYADVSDAPTGSQNVAGPFMLVPGPQA